MIFQLPADPSPIAILFCPAKKASSFIELKGRLGISTKSCVTLSIKPKGPVGKDEHNRPM